LPNFRGFTLIEILLVIAIIAILATIVFVGTAGQRQRARMTGAVASVKSAMTPAMACISLDGEIQEPAETGGNAICSGSSEISESITWPVLPNNCFYCDMPYEGTITFRCSGSCGGIGGEDSFCDYRTSQCEIRN